MKIVPLSNNNFSDAPLFSPLLDQSFEKIRFTLLSSLDIDFISYVEVIEILGQA